MKNFRSMTPTLFVAAVAITSGVPVLVGALWVIPSSDAAIGDSFTGETTGVFELPIAAEQAFTALADVYWNPTTGRCTADSTKGPRIGVAAAASGATTVDVLINAPQPARPPLTQPQSTLTITHNAFTEGTSLVSLVLDARGPYLAFDSLAATRGYCAFDTDALALECIDDPGTTVQATRVYVDINGDTDARLVADIPVQMDVYVPTANGRLLRIAHDADAAAKLALRYKGDAAFAARLQFTNGWGTSLTQTTSPIRSAHATYGQAS